MSHVDEGRLHAYLDGELTPVERARVDEHLAGCLACRTRLDEERQLIERAGKLLAFAMPADRAAPPFSALTRPRPRRFWHVRMPLAWAATVVLAVGLGWTLAVQMMPGRRAPETLGGPIAERQNQSPSAQQPMAPVPTTAGRLDIRRERGPRERPEPALAQKAAPFRDTNATDALRAISKPAEEQRGAGSVAAPPPAPAPAANAPARNLDVRLQAVTVTAEAAPALLDSAAAHAILGREPVTIPGLPVRQVTRSSRWPDEVIVEQALDSTQVIMLWERPIVPASTDTVPVATRHGATFAKTTPDYVGVGRVIVGVWVQITGAVKTDSLKKLLGKIKP
jgi:hypothetical protein